MAFESPTQRAGALLLFSQWQIVVGTLFGGMPLGCAFVALNYHRIRSAKNARIFWLLAMIGLLVGLFVALWVPLAILSALVLGLFSNAMQSRILRFVDANAQFESWWVVAGWCGAVLVSWFLFNLAALTMLQMVLQSAR
jgi:hypothetical protein